MSMRQMKNDQRHNSQGLTKSTKLKASNLYSQLSEAFAYFEPDLWLDDKKLAEFKEQEPGLGLYDHYLRTPFGKQGPRSFSRS